MPFAFLLSACAGDRSFSSTPSQTSYPESLSAANGAGAGGLVGPDHVALAASAYLGGSVGQSASAANMVEDSEQGCAMRKRLDGGSTLAYNFDAQSRLGFNLQTTGGLDRPIELKRAMLVFHYRLQDIKSSNEHCQYASHWQGLVGSGYNELVLRDHNTVWSVIRDHGLDFWRR